MKWLLGILVLLGLGVGIGAGVLSSGMLELPLAELETRYRTPESKFVDLDGVRVHYRDEGEGPPIILVHASFMSLRAWDPVAASLKAKHRVIRFDMLTAGLTSPAASGKYSIERNMDLLDRLATKLGVDRFALLGTSSGGIVAFRYTAQHPERVERLVLVNSAGLPRTAMTDPNRARGSKLDQWIRRHYQSRAFWQQSLTEQFGGGTPPPPEFVDMVYDMNRRAGLRGEAMKYMKNFSTGDPESVLSQITTPTLILWGMGNITVDHLQADVFEHWLKNAPTAKKKYPKVGHYLYWEIPDEFNADVERFLAGEWPMIEPCRNPDVQQTACIKTCSAPRA